MAIERRPWLLRYGSAPAGIVLATLICRRLDPILGGHAPFMIYLVAIAFAAWYGGLGPAILALVLGWLSADFLIVHPRGSLLIGGIADQVTLALFVVAGLAIASLGGAKRTAQRHAERVLEEERAQRERLRVTLQSIGDGIVIVSPDGRVSALNPVAEQLTGWCSDESLGQPLGAVLRTIDEVRLMTDEAPAGNVLGESWGLRQSNSTTLISKDGTSRSILYSTAPIVEDGKGINGVVISLRDVTERERAEEALRESEERFSRFMQQLPGLAWIKDVEGRYVYANDAAEKAFRTPRAKLYGKTDDEVFPPEIAAQFKENDRRALTSGTGVQVVETLEHEDGIIHHSLVSKFPITGPDGKAAMVGGMAIDITDRKRAEEVLAESEVRFRQLAESINEVFWMADPESTEILYISPAFERVWGRSCESLYRQPRSYLDAVHPEDSGRVSTAFLEKHRRGEPTEEEYRIIRPDGTVRWIRDRGFPITDANGRVYRFAGIAEDMTEKKQADEALQEADRRKDEFLATLAHELRNPLAPIRNALHLMKRPAGEGSDNEPERAMAERQVIHLARLIDDLMDIARISHGKIELRMESVELVPVVDRAIESVRSSLEDRRHELSVTFPAEPVYVEADPTRLEQVFWNLLNNAIKYTEPGGAIRIVVEREEGQVAVRVRDTGVGIERELLPRIFEMFVQVGDNPERSQGGLGIGLSLVRTLVEMHGGGVLVRSEGRGEGAEFIVRLPTLKGAPRGRTEPTRGDQPQPSATLPRSRILVVDDNVDAANSLAKLLARAYKQEVRIAHDGLGALEAAGEFHPEVILLDIGMPGMDGYEVAKRLRSRPESEGTLLVALTGWGQESDRHRSREAGFDHHLVKPVDPQDLRRLLAGIGAAK